MNKAIIGTFFKTLKKAKIGLKRKNKLFKNSFTIIKFKKGYLVVSKRQLL